MTTSSDHEFDLFISYAHADDVENAIGLMVEAIQAEHAKFTPRPLNIFFDRDAIQSMHDWEHRILRGIRESKVMLAVLSPAYFESEYCRKEWELYVDHELSQAMPGEAIAPIYIATYDAFESHAQDALNEWIRNLKRRQYVDVRNWWSEGAAALQRDDVRRRLELLNQQIGERLSRLMRVHASPTSVPEHNSHFVGRVEELRSLREKLALGRVGQAVALNGIGGIGKSAIAFEYAHSYADDYPDGRYMIGCEGVSDLAEAMLKLIPQMGIELTELEQRSLDLAVARVRSVLGAGKRTLLLMDNVDDPKLLSPQSRARCLPDGAKVHVLATTRLGADQLVGVESLPIDSLGERDAVRLLENHRPFSAQNSDEEFKAALRIVHMLGSHALAVEVVAVYLWKNPDISYQDYQERLEEEGFAAVDDAGADELVELSRHTEKVIGELVGSMLDGLSDDEREAVRMGALLPPDCIAADWLKTLAAENSPRLKSPPKKGHPDPWKRLTRRLEGLRLLTPADDDRMLFRMHRLVQGVVCAGIFDELDGRLAAARSLAEERGRLLSRNWADRAARWELVPLMEFAYHRMAREDVAGARLANRLTEPLHKLGRFGEARRLLRRAIEFNDREDDEADRDSLAVSCSNLGMIELSLGDETAGREWLGRAIEIWENMPSPDKSLLARSYSNLSSLDRAAGEYEAARIRLHRAIKLWKSAEKPDYRALATGYANLAVVESALGQPETARQWHRAAIKIREKVFPKNHPTLAISYSNLSGVEADLANYAEARNLIQKAIAIREQTLDAEHPQLAASYSRLASLEMELSNMTEARELLVRTIRIQEHAFDPDHPSLAASHSSLASVESELAEFASARESYERALSIQRKILKPNHPHLAVSLSSLGSMERELGHYPAALDLCEQALAIRREVFRPDHPVLANSYQQLGALMRTLARFPEARSLFEQSREIREATSAADHPSQAGILSAIAGLEQELANFDLARELHDRAFAIREQVYGPDDPAVANSCAAIASLERELGNLVRSRELAERAAAINEKKYADGHPSRARSLAGLASLERACGNLQLAMHLHEQALAIRRDVYDENHPQLAGSYAAMASIHHALGDAATARSLSEQAIDIRRSVFEPRHPLLASSYAGLAAIDRKDNQLVAARERLLLALEIDEQAYGTGHPSVARDCSTLALVEADDGNVTEARRLMNRAWVIRHDKYGPDHARTKTCFDWLTENDPEFPGDTSPHAS